MCSNDNCFGSNYYFPSNSINTSSSCPKKLLYGEVLAWNFLSKLSSEDGYSEVRVTTSFLMIFDEKLL